MVPSKIDSPIWGMMTSVGMDPLSASRDLQARQFLPDYKSRARGRFMAAGWDRLGFGAGTRSQPELRSGVSSCGKFLRSVDFGAADSLPGDLDVEPACARSAVEILDGQDLLVEDQAELAGGLVGDGFESWAVGCGVGDFPFEAGDGPVGDAAGIDEREVAQVGGDVEGEAVGGDAARDVDADGADLAFPCGWIFGRSRTTLVQRAAVRRQHQTPVRPQMRPARTP